MIKPKGISILQYILRGCIERGRGNETEAGNKKGGGGSKTKL
jgi:hypothetical protein